MKVKFLYKKLQIENRLNIYNQLYVDEKEELPCLLYFFDPWAYHNIEKKDGPNSLWLRWQVLKKKMK